MGTPAKYINRVNFSKARVDSFQCPEDRSEAFLWDTGAPGLAVRARSTGGKQYIFQARLHGRTMRLNIGSPDAWDIENARAEARRLRVLVDNGLDPREEASARKRAADEARLQKAREALTLVDVWPEYIEARRADWSATHLQDHYKAMRAPGEKRLRRAGPTVPGPLWSLRNERLAELNAQRLLTWLNQEKTTRPTVTARAYRLLRACLAWVEDQPQYRGLVASENLFTGEIRRAVPKPRARGDVLQREQLQPWFEAVRNLRNSVTSAYLQALLLTGARREEMAQLRWQDVDSQWGSLKIRDKTTGERVIPLTPYLAELLADLPRRNEWVFSSPTAASGRITDANQAHTQMLVVAGLPHLTLHGLRRSFGTLAEWVECPVGVVAQIQGHKPSALAEKHYRRRPLDLLRMWHTRIEGWLLEQAHIPQPEGSEAGTRLNVIK